MSAFGWSALAGWALVVAALVIGCGSPVVEPGHSGSSEWEAQRPDPVLAAAGAEVFSDVCSNCHGLAGRGADRAPSLTDIGLSASDVESMIRSGVNPPSMPAFAASLTEDEIAAVAAYTVQLRYSDSAQ